MFKMTEFPLMLACLLVINLLGQASAAVSSCYVGTTSASAVQTSQTSKQYCFKYMSSSTDATYGSDSGTLCPSGTGLNIISTSTGVYYYSCCDSNNCNTPASNTKAVSSCYVGLNSTTKVSISSSYCVRASAQGITLYTYDIGIACTSAGTSSMKVSGASGTLYCCTSDNCNPANSLNPQRMALLLMITLAISSLMRISLV